MESAGAAGALGGDATDNTSIGSINVSAQYFLDKLLGAFLFYNYEKL